MIYEYIVKGSNETTFHDFSVGVESNVLTVSDGEYINKNNFLFKSEEDTVIELEDGKEYNVWLTGEGVKVLERSDDFFDYIDLLAWGSLNDLHVRKMVKE